MEIDEVSAGIMYEARSSYPVAQPKKLTTLRLAVQIPQDYLAKLMYTLLRQS